jgi:UDP-glucuronate decarboxylase
VRILVTGGAGFIGSHLCKRLLEEGHSVVCLDNFYTGRKQNIAELDSDKNFTVVERDVEFPYLDLKVDGIFNLACPAAPLHYQIDPIRTLKTNVMGAINGLELAKKLDVRILQASTSEVYGDPLINPQVEDYWGNVNPIGIRSCYDEGKRAAETLFIDYKRQFGIDIRVMRIFNTFGPKMNLDDGRVVSNFVIQALRNNPLTVYGNGEQTRSFCYVEDLVEGMIRYFFAENQPDVMNFGNPAPISMNALANEIIHLCESKSAVAYLELPADDPRLREPNIDLARKHLGWEPKTLRVEGLRLTIEYFRRLLD